MLKLTLKISFVGAGSLVFGENVLSDILSHPSLRKDTLICLEDIDNARLDLIYRYMNKIKETYPKKFDGVEFEKTTDQNHAIEDSKYIICAI
ncbi:MAG: hypothetical protein GF383_13300, partial [Candidatus Lokiarchaeota archaeon]|nr:hypothetical protein [Candidatus Lokiarchaeota archaeon]MBD3342156.1 hypothetical protein [Candidatus Lokiarchaeota archaeon]